MTFEPHTKYFDEAMAAVKVELDDVNSGPRVPRMTSCSHSLVMFLRTLATYKGPNYNAWEVLWRCGDRSTYREGGTYIAAIYRIGPDLRGDPDYDYYGELPLVPCSGDVTTLFPWTPELERDVLEWTRQ